MNEHEAKQIVEEIKNKRLYDHDKIESFLKPKNLLSSDKMKLFAGMAEDFIFDHLYLAPHLMEVFSGSDEFMSLILLLAEKNCFQSIQQLFKAYSLSATDADILLDKVTKSNDDRAIASIAHLLQGMAQVNFKRFLETTVITDNLNRPTKIGYIEALRMVTLTQKIPKSHVDMILCLISREPELRSYCVNFLLVGMINDPDADEKLMEIASSGNTRERIQLASNCYVLCKHRPDFALRILQALSKSSEPEVLNAIPGCLGAVADKYPVEALRIIQMWSRNSALRNKIGLSWVPEQIGKGYTNEADSYLENWINEENDALVIMFDLPTLIRDIFEKNNKSKLVEVLGKIQLIDENKLMVFSKALEMSLSEEYDKNPRNQDFIDKAFELVCKRGNEKAIDPTKIEPNLGDKLMRTLAIVDSLEIRKRQIDFEIARNNLKYIPNFISFLGPAWFAEGIDTKDASHQLFALLAYPETDQEKISGLIEEFKASEGEKMRQWSILSAIRWELQPLAELIYFDTAIGLFLRDKHAKLKRLKAGLTNKDEFFQTIGELVLAAHLKMVYPTRVQHNVTTNRPVDCQVEIDGKEILIEILSPEIAVETKYVRTVMRMDNRVREKIQDKLKKQIPAIANATPSPIFLAINRTRAIDLDETMVADMLYGTTQITWLMDKKEGKIVKAFPTRADDAISKEASGRLISGVIFYKMDLDLADGKLKLFGDIYKNANSERPVTDDLIGKMKDTIFNKALSLSTVESS